MYKTEIRTVINLLQEGPPSRTTVKRAIMTLIRLESQINSLYKELNETAKKQYEQAKADILAKCVPLNRWIPVTERLPEAKVDVLAVIHYKDGRTAVNQGWYSALNEQWYIGVAGIHAPVTHWMPLPEPPEMDGGNHGTAQT